MGQISSYLKASDFESHSKISIIQARRTLQSNSKRAQIPNEKALDHVSSFTGTGLDKKALFTGTGLDKKAKQLDPRSTSGRVTELGLKPRVLLAPLSKSQPLKYM